MPANKKQKKSAKSFALQHWETFEKLSMQIVKDLYNGKIGKLCKLTPSRSDGGYDGFICFPISPYNSSELYKILLEAKLRSSSMHDLPLSEFSKTIVIAINTIADKVYISTNAYFSAETNRRLMTYSQRTGLEIHTIDICSITSWINEHRAQAEKICDSDFLDTLVGMNHSLKPNQRELSIESEPLIQERVGIPSLIGEQRKSLLYALGTTLSNQNGILIIQATEGEGKTVFVENLLQILQQKYGRIAHLDLNCFSDIREVFIQLLSIAWGIGTSEIYGMSKKELDEVTKYLGDQEFPPKSRTTLIYMIHQPQEQFNKSRTLHSELLLDYLRVIFPPLLRRVRCLVVISNLTSATRNALDFLCSFMKILSGQAISFLVKAETREDFSYTDNVAQFLSEIKREPVYLDTVSLPSWGFADAKEFLDARLPWLNNEAKRQFIRFFGLRPLALSAGAEVIQKSDLARVLKLSGVGLPSSIAQRHFTLGCIDHIVEDFATTGGQSVQFSLILLGLFDGEVEIKMLEEIASANGFPSPSTTLCICPFLRQVETRIRVLHGAYQNSIRKFHFVTKAFLYQALTQIEPLLEAYFSDPEYVTRKRFSILHLTKNFEGLRSVWVKLATIHMAHGETELLYEVLKTVYEWWMEDTSFYQLNLFDQYWLLYHLAESVLILHGANAAELRCYLNQLDTVFKLVPEADWPGGTSALRRAKAETLNLKSQISLGLADYHNMLAYANEGISLLEGDLTTQGLDCMGTLWADKALALKHIDNISSCIHFLESGRELLTGVNPFTFCYYTHKASLYSVKYPRIALMYFDKVKQECECSINQLLHTEHNIATMHFALGEYSQAAKISGHVWVQAYENNVAIEEGRSSHLLGCIAWVKNEMESANEHFLAAYKLFQRHVHRTHLWPPLINLSTLCMEMGKNIEALEYTNCASEFLLQFHLNSINHLDMSSDLLPKLYVGVLILLDHYEHLNTDAPLKMDLLKKITLPELHYAYNTYVKTNRLSALLRETGYLFEGKYILKV